MKKAIAGILAVLTLGTFLLAACGGGGSSSESEKMSASTSAKTTVPASGSTSANTSETTTELEVPKGTIDYTEKGTTTKTTEPDLSPATENSITAVEAIDIANKAVEALKNTDIEKIMQYTSIDDFVRIESPDMTEDEIAAAFKSAMEDETNAGNSMNFLLDGKNFNMTFTGGTPLTENELKKINDFVDMFLGKDENVSYLPKITGGYKLDLEFPDDGNDYDRDANLYVLNINGKYELDLCYTLMMEMYGMFTETMESATEGSSIAYDNENEDGGKRVIIN